MIVNNPSPRKFFSGLVNLGISQGHLVKDGLTQDMAVNQGMLVIACDLIPILFLQESSSWVSLNLEIPRVNLSTHIEKLSYGN